MSMVECGCPMRYVCRGVWIELCAYVCLCVCRVCVVCASVCLWVTQGEITSNCIVCRWGCVCLRLHVCMSIYMCVCVCVCVFASFSEKALPMQYYQLLPHPRPIHEREMKSTCAAAI